MGLCLSSNNDIHANGNNGCKSDTSNPQLNNNEMIIVSANGNNDYKTSTSHTHLRNAMERNEIEDQDDTQKMISVWKRQEDVFNMLMSMNIQWDGNIISEDIWRIVAEYIISKSNQYTKRKAPKYTI